MNTSLLPAQMRASLLVWLNLHRRSFIVVFHLGLVAASSYAAIVLRFDGAIPAENFGDWWRALPILLAVRAASFVPFRLYQGLWRYSSIWDLRNIVAAVGLSTLAAYVGIHLVFGWTQYPRSVFIIDSALLVLALGGVRMTRRVLTEFGAAAEGRRVLVYGAGDAGELIVRDMKNNQAYGYRPIGFIDDDRSKVGARIHGVPVLGTRHDVSAVLEEHRPTEVLIALPGADPAVLRSVFRVFEPYKIPIKTLPNLRDIMNGKVQIAQIREFTVADLLTRAPIGLDSKPLKHLIESRRVLVTGAGGSIGSELCRQVAALNPSSLVMVERYENSLHAVRLELDDLQNRALTVRPVVADVTDEERVDAVFRDFRPEIVFHAAAHKHVPLMEENPCEAVKNNVRGTRILAEAAERHGVDRFILISTDKAVNPTNVMGASKRLAELVIQAQAFNSATSYSIVRFGNVLGSNGSVVPRFLEQIRKGGPVTVTHPEIRRFFMLIPEAVHLVLHAAAQAESGATYVLEMGEQVKLLDMARDMIRASGFIPEDEIAIEFTGLRPGEKLYEELVGAGEEASPSAVAKILRVTNRAVPAPGIMSAVTQIEALATVNDSRGMLTTMRNFLPEFTASTAPIAPPLSGVTPLAIAHVAPETISVTGSGLRCPKCGAADVGRSRARNIFERLRRDARPERLYKCEPCGWRGWLVPLQFLAPSEGFARSLAAPDLVSLDEATTTFARSRSKFSPHDIV